MSFQRLQMLYDDGKYYKWDAKMDNDNPYYTHGKDHSEMNKTEGYEVLYFINHLGRNFWETAPNTATFQKVERMIKESIPGNIRTHKAKEQWIIKNWNNVPY